MAKRQDTMIEDRAGLMIVRRPGIVVMFDMTAKDIDETIRELQSLKRRLAKEKNGKGQLTRR